MNKKALSPLIATLLLVIFALILGAITMNFGKTVVQEEQVKQSAYTISAASVDNQLKEVQIDYLLGRITLDQYLEREKVALDEMGR